MRAIESGRGIRGGRDDGDAVPCIRLAQVGDAVEDEPGAGEPYIYEADIFTGRWDDDGAARTAVAETIEVWSDVALTADAWVGVLRVGNHWETIGSAGGDGGTAEDPATYDTIGGTTEGNEAADDGDWTAGGANGLWLYAQTRHAYYHGGDKKWYAYVRKIVVDASGRIYSVGGETRVEIETPVLWTP